MNGPYRTNFRLYTAAYFIQLYVKVITSPGNDKHEILINALSNRGGEGPDVMRCYVKSGNTGAVGEI